MAEFERVQGVRLPSEYRHYLLTVAAAPPGYSEGYQLHECLEDQAKYGDFLRSPFPHSDSWNDRECGDYDDPRHVAGSLVLTHEGCGHYYRLVVTGPMRGTVWDDSRGSDEGVTLLRNASGEPMTFLEWLNR